MNRRRFTTTLAGGVTLPAFLASSVRARHGPMPLVGFLSGRSPGETARVLAAFQQGLAETGYVDGKNIAIEYRWAEGQYDRLPALAAELVGCGVAVIAATGGSVSGLAAKAATTTIPIVFASGGDAIALGLVPSLNRPGGNVTGVNLTFGALGPKRLELLREFIPAAKVVGMIANPNYPSAAAEIESVRAGARSLGLEIAVFDAPAVDDFEPVFRSLSEQRIAGLLVGDDPFLQSHRFRLVRLAAQYGIPTIYFSRDFTEEGGLMSYGPNLPDAYRLVGTYTGRILNGENPADLPVQQPARFELVINLQIARALGLAVPQSLLVRADKVIE
jgi:putative ABC transport system substrate-binding protein